MAFGFKKPRWLEAQTSVRRFKTTLYKPVGDVTVAMPIFSYAATVAMHLIYKLGMVQFETLNMYCFKCPLAKYWMLTSIPNWHFLTKTVTINVHLNYKEILWYNPATGIQLRWSYLTKLAEIIISEMFFFSFNNKNKIPPVPFVLERWLRYQRQTSENLSR